MDNNKARGRRTALVAALVVALVAVVPAMPAGASHRERQRELDRLIREKRSLLQQSEAQAQDLISQLNASDQRRAALQARISRLQSRLASARQQILVLETKLDGLQVALKKKNTEIEQTLAQLQVQTDQLNMRVALTYMVGPPDVDALPGVSEDLSDMVSRSEYQRALVANDERLVHEIEATKATLDDQRAEIEATQAEVEAKRLVVADRAREISSANNQLLGARGQMDREIAFKRTLLKSLRAQQNAYREAIQSYKSESESIAAFLRGAQAGQNVIAGRGGWLKWPVSGRITSPYGPRRHPVYGYESFHTGIDIAAPTGTLVKAARGGEVIYSGYKGAFGLVVIIDHGSGIATMYAHLSSSHVHEGEAVKTLEGIAAVGSTGWSTGPHLHFEVRAGGEPTDPMRWL